MLRLEDQLCFALGAASHAVVRSYRPLLARLGLTHPQYLLLVALWQDGPSTVGALASRLALPAHGLSPLLARLEARGLVERRRDADDRRVVHVHLTEAGRALQVPAEQVQHEVVCSTALSSTELAALRADLLDLVARMAPPSLGGTAPPPRPARRHRREENVPVPPRQQERHD